jgi:hypothetical protein
MTKRFHHTMSALAFSLLTLLAVPALACDTCPDAGNAFVGIHPSVAFTKIQPSESQLVASFIDTQLRAHGLTKDQYLALSAEHQRAILTPGRTWFMSREMRRTIVPKSVSVPRTVQSQLIAEKTVSDKVLQDYAIELPSTLQLSFKNPSARRVLIGDKLLQLSAENIITDVSPILE